MGGKRWECPEIQAPLFKRQIEAKPPGSKWLSVHHFATAKQKQRRRKINKTAGVLRHSAL